MAFTSADLNEELEQINAALVENGVTHVKMVNRRHDMGGSTRVLDEIILESEQWLTGSSIASGTPRECLAEANHRYQQLVSEQKDKTIQALRDDLRELQRVTERHTEKPPEHINTDDLTDNQNRLMRFVTRYGYINFTLVGDDCLEDCEVLANMGLIVLDKCRMKLA